MNAVLRLGARVDRRLVLPWGFVGRAQILSAGVLLFALASALAWVDPANASVLYRCVGNHGTQAYVSHTKGYHHCVKIGQWHVPAVHRVALRERRPPRHDQPSGTVLPGKPPRPVKANPAVLKVTPLGGDDSIKVKALPPPVWQPLPVAALQALGRALPALVGMEPAPPPPQAAPAGSVRPASAATTPIPLKLDADAPKPPRRGAVYRVVKKDGTVLYTNIASLAKGHHATQLFTYIIECYACDVHSKIDWNTVPLHLAAYRGDIRSAAKHTGVNAALLRAVIHAESGFNPRALSYKGAQGLMQLMPTTASEMGVGDAFDPAENISGGARYLATLLRDYHGDVQLAAAAYNAGPGAVAKYGGVPPYAQTQVYVKRVALLYQRYRKALKGPAVAAAN